MQTVLGKQHDINTTSLHCPSRFLGICAWNKGTHSWKQIRLKLTNAGLNSLVAVIYQTSSMSLNLFPLFPLSMSTPTLNIIGKNWACSGIGIHFCSMLFAFNTRVRNFWHEKLATLSSSRIKNVKSNSCCHNKKTWNLCTSDNINITYHQVRMWPQNSHIYIYGCRLSVAHGITAEFETIHIVHFHDDLLNRQDVRAWVSPAWNFTASIGIPLSQRALTCISIHLYDV